MTDKNDDNSYAKITGNTVELFGQKFPLDYKLYKCEELDRPKYYPTGELESFRIKPTVIQFKSREIPIGIKIILHKNGKFHGSCIHLGHNYDLTGHREFTYEHKGNTFYIGGAIFFYESGNLKSIDIDSPANGPGNHHDSHLPRETNFLLEDKKLLLFGGDRIFFYDESGLPKTVQMSSSRNAQFPKYAPPVIDNVNDYNVIEISEEGKITAAILEPRPNYDYD